MTESPSVLPGSAAGVGATAAVAPVHAARDEVSHSRVRADCRLIRRTANRLGRPYLLRRFALLIVMVIVYWLLARAILDYGAGVDYTRLGPPDAAIVSLLNRVNPYIWWAVVVILALVVLFWLRARWENSVLRARAVPVPADDVRRLAAELSPPVLDVVRWVWVDRHYPLTQGDLRRVIAEVHGGRIQDMRLAEEQHAILGGQRES